MKEKDLTPCIIFPLFYLSMHFTSQQLCLYRYIARTRSVDQHTYWTHSQCNTLGAPAVVTVNSGEWIMIRTSNVTKAVNISKNRFCNVLYLKIMIGPLMIICVYLHLFNVLYSSKEKFFILRKLIQKFDAYDLHKIIK